MLKAGFDCGHKVAELDFDGGEVAASVNVDAVGHEVVEALDLLIAEDTVALVFLVRDLHLWYGVHGEDFDG